MKTLKHILLVTIIAVFAVACNEGIDDITRIEPGVDATAPVVKIIYPAEGTAIKVFEDVTSINIEIEVTDDIEIDNIIVKLNGAEIANFNEFTDYRRALEEFTYDNLVDGNHILTVEAMDIEGKLTTSEVNFQKEPPYLPMFAGEVLYMPFDGDYMDLIGFNLATEVGVPGFADTSYAGTNAYMGATDAYLTMPAEELLSDEFSAAFWYKVDANPDRAGILVLGADENRTQGFRLFREGSADEQRIKLNVGTGDGESWNDGGVIDVTAGEWVHVAFTISQTKSIIYFNGIEMNAADLSSGIDWTGAENLTIGSGGETFSYWDHKSDNSSIDELRVFNKAITQSDIQIMLNSFNPYIPQYAGESFYMPFDNGYINLIGSASANPIGSPEITDASYEGDGAYLGVTDSYLTYPSEGLMSNQFSASFWYKVNASPDRAGILVVGDNADDRNQGFRLFREGSADEQRIKLNVGTGTGDVWNDGGVITVADGEWVHIAMTISDTQNKIYFNGVEVNSADMSAPIDWTGVEEFTIGSGEPTFGYWDHKSDSSIIDELRFFDKELSSEEVIAITGGAYTPPYFGSIFYMPFDGSNLEKVTNVGATIVGTPGFAGESAQGSDSYAGAVDSYLTFPTSGLTTTEFSAAMWYKLNNDPDRAGILVMGPEDVDNGGYPDVQNKRTNGFRFFRENGDDGNQRFKLNVGDGSADTWADGGANADVDPTTGNWIHLAFTISSTDAIVYIDGQVVAQASISGIDWTGSDILSIMSGAPRFTEWGHSSDLSYIDELYLFDEALTQEEIQAIID
jgi:Concanavalin A-like lectin/glucanases superfamily/Bacterial Ig domain